MKDINCITLTGRLTRDSEIKYTNSGFAICSFSLAFNRTKKEGSEYKSKPCFIECTIIGKYGEAMAPHLTQGRQATISGEIDFDSWEKDGQKRSKHSIKIENIVLASTGEKKPNSKQQSPVDDSDIPF